MSLRIFVFLAILAIASLSRIAVAAGNDNPLVYMVMVDELEWRKQSGDDALTWHAEVWTGYDQNKFVLKTEGETNSESTEEFELRLLYARAISPFWDLQLGWRGDFQPVTPRNWASLGVEGMAPGFIELEATAFVGSSGRTAARVKAIYEMFFTQQVVLEPKLELNWYGEDDPVNGIGSGLSDLEFGLRLRYRIRREFAPYIGLNWTRLYGDTRDFAEARGDDASDLQAVVGFRIWF